MAFQFSPNLSNTSENSSSPVNMESVSARSQSEDIYEDEDENEEELDVMGQIKKMVQDRCVSIRTTF